MLEFDEIDELDELDEIGTKQGGGGLKEEGDHVDPETSGKLGESDVEYYREKQAEAEAKGEYGYAEDYKEMADAEKIYDEIKD